jgi:DNA-binding CsgD family transcriptional regulator
MALLDDQRRHADVNGPYLNLLGYRREQLVGHPVYEIVIGGPLATDDEWQAALRSGSFTGEAPLRRVDGSPVSVQWAATTEVVTGKRFALFVVMSSSRWGASFRRSPQLQRLTQMPLTKRELEVIRLVALGATGREIGEELQVSHATVRTHARNAMIKTGARSRAQLVAKALAEGLALE